MPAPCKILDTAQAPFQNFAGARALLGWSRQDLAARNEAVCTTIADYELGEIAPQRRTLRGLIAALEA